MFFVVVHGWVLCCGKGVYGEGWSWWRVEVVEGGGLCALCCLVFRLMVFFFSRGRGCTLRVGVNESGKEA